MTRPLALVVLLAAGLPLAGCLPDGLTDFDFPALQPPRPAPEPVEAMTRVGALDAGALRVAVDAFGGSAGTIPGGLRAVRVTVTTPAGAPVPGARVSLRAEAARGDAWLALPATSPAAPTDPSGVAEGQVVLLPESDGAAARVVVRVDDGPEAVLAVAVPTAPRRLARTADGATWAVWLAPARPLVGDNTVEIALIEEIGGAAVPAAGRRVELYPYMDMGGGDGHSTPFSPPAEVAPGVWRSRVDFIMSGGWELTVRSARPGEALQPAVFRGFTVDDP